MNTASRARAWRMMCLGTAIVALGAFACAGADDYAAARAAMVQSLRKSGIRDERVLDAMGRVPRHLFVSDGNRASAYQEAEVGAAGGEVVLCPHAVAVMLESLNPPRRGRVLEVGVRSGYETALLAELSDQVFTVESRRKVAAVAKDRLHTLRYDTVQVQVGDGLHGWPEKAPFDAILVTFPVERLPETLLNQLAEGGRLVFALGSGPEQTLNRVEKLNGRLRSEIVTTGRLLPAPPTSRPREDGRRGR